MPDDNDNDSTGGRTGYLVSNESLATLTLDQLERLLFWLEQSEQYDDFCAKIRAELAHRASMN